VLSAGAPPPSWATLLRRRAPEGGGAPGKDGAADDSRVDPGARPSRDRPGPARATAGPARRVARLPAPDRDSPADRHAGAGRRLSGAQRPATALGRREPRPHDRAVPARLRGATPAHRVRVRRAVPRRGPGELLGGALGHVA